MACPIRRHARARPQTRALIGPTSSWTYEEFDAAIASTQAQLAGKGVAPGARVALVPSRSVSTVLVLWALWRIGAVAVPLSSRWPSATRKKASDRVDCDLFIEAPSRLLDSVPEKIEGPSQGDPKDAPESHPTDRDATIVFTSGSTGPPKAVLHSWSNHLYSAKGSNANLPLRPGDRWLLSLPVYHVGGLAILVRCALAGAAVILPDTERSLQWTLKHRCVTHLSCVATQLRRLMAASEGPPDGLRGLLLGGGPLPNGLVARANGHGWPVLTSYGCTEMASQVTTTAAGAPPSELRTAGRRLPHRNVCIGTDGEILVKGPTLCSGYVEGRELRDPRNSDGWFPTGDRGRLDARGNLHVLGRMDNMFVSGGENIQPEEIEHCLEGLDGVERAVVVPVSDEEYGRRPVAFVRGERAKDGLALQDALARALPAFKIPDEFYPLPAGGQAGGLQGFRSELRERAEDESTDLPL